MEKEIRWTIVVVAAIVALGLAFSFPAIVKDHDYSHYADMRARFGIPNFNDVISNLAFLLVGLLGLQYIHKKWDDRRVFSHHIERLLWITFFISIIGICFGSGYYHLNPSYQTLFWDRFPLSVTLTSLFAIVFAERVSFKVIRWLAPALILTGMFSVIYWRATSDMGVPDDRLYLVTQFFPVFGIPLLGILFPSRYGDVKDLFAAVGFYIIAKMCEAIDFQVFDLTHHIISGHTIKHLTAAIGAYFILRYLKSR